jgi:uncharacterized protein
MYNPSDKEQEYFLRQEAERLKQLRDEHQKKLAVQEQQRLKELHHMHCPKCGAGLHTTKLHEVEVDICPACGGLWLDAGELGKILDEAHRGAFTTAAKTLRDFFRSSK